MRRARAHSSSCLQVILLYVHPSCLNSLFCGRKLQKFTKNTYFAVDGHLRSLMLVVLKGMLPRIAQKSPLFLGVTYI